MKIHPDDVLIPKKYKIILADPPWTYNDSSCSGSIGLRYKTMYLKDICNLKVNELADDDCVLFLWATYPLLKEALKVIDAWRFIYKSIAFQWIKRNKQGVGYFYGLGRWTRGNTEPCLLAVKGEPKRINPDVFQIIDARLRNHSQKPDAVYTKIERLMGDLPRIELFAREKREGWDAWGDQLPNTKQMILK